MAKNSKPKTPSQSGALIVRNKKATFDFFVEERMEAGIVLEGWEVKSLRAGKVNVTDSYVFIKNGEVWMTGVRLQPLQTASTHVKPEPERYKKLLLKNKEIARLIGLVEQKGYTLIVLSLYWKFGRAKAEIGVAKGKKDHDKRETAKTRDWDIEKRRVMKQNYR
jgi:SsrA-binding protein